LNDEKKKQAALDFAELQPVQWDAFLAKWEADHSEPTETVTVKPEVTEPEAIEPVAASPEPTVEVQDAADAVAIPEAKKRKAVARKVKAAES